MLLLEQNWPAVKALAPDTPVVIPIAALEQHGRHMPVFTDSLLLGEVVRRVADSLADRVLFTPLMWLGNSEHHLDFAGTMTARPRVYLDMLQDMVENFLFHGFRRIVLLNGHGGNITPAQQALFEVRQKYRQREDLLLLSTTYWTLGSQPHKEDSSFKQQEMGHACEWETSMMLVIRPDLVGELKGLEPVEFGRSFTPAHRAWITKDRTATGHIGFPHLATREKGEKLFTLFARDAVAFLERVVNWNGQDWEG